MTSSKKMPQAWQADPLLSVRPQSPHFVRTHWDQKSAQSFGPWRLAEMAEPTDSLQSPPPDLIRVGSQTPSPTTAREDSAQLPETGNADTASASPAELEAVRSEAFAQGLAQGLAQGQEEGRTAALAELQAERQREGELLRHLGIELRSLGQDPERFFEPLRRLALHLAEQLVRGELQISGKAIERLVQQCLQQIEHPQSAVEVQLHPEDLERLQALGPAAIEGLQLQADANLRPGSVRVRVQDTVVQDLIEHRLEPLVRRLLAEPDAWLQRSALVGKLAAEALPEDAPRRQWSQQVVDVQDADPRHETEADKP